MSQTKREPAPTRRGLIAGLGGMAAAQGFLQDALGAQSNPAAVVEDRASNIKITKLTCTPADPKCILKLETNYGITGWGEISNVIPDVATPLANRIFELLDGQNPTRIEHLWQLMYRAHRNLRGGPFMVHTISGIDMALWDIVGKLWNVPIYRLLGGPTRDKIRVYHTDKARKIALPSGRRRTMDLVFGMLAFLVLPAGPAFVCRLLLRYPSQKRIHPVRRTAFRPAEPPGSSQPHSTIDHRWSSGPENMRSLRVRQ